jgi:hypothetical protein
MARFTNPSSGGSQSNVFDTIEVTDNGAGINIKVGDDAYIGDSDIANHVSIIGQQDSLNGGIVLGERLSESITTDGSNLSLSADNDIVLLPGSDYAYLNTVDPNYRIATMSDLRGMTLIAAGDIASGTELLLENISGDYKDLLFCVDNLVFDADTPLFVAIGDPESTGTGGYWPAGFFGQTKHITNQSSSSGTITNGSAGDINNDTSGFNLTLGRSAVSGLAATANIVFKVYDYSKAITINQTVNFKSNVTYSYAGWRAVDTIEGTFNINSAYHGMTPVSKLALKTNGTANFTSGTIDLYGQNVYSGGTYRLYGIK